MGLMPCDFAEVNSTLSACAMIPNQQNFTRHDERFNFSTIFSTAKSGKFTSLSRAIKRSVIHLEVLSSQNRKYFEHFLCFHRTLGISPKDLAGKIQSWYRFHLHDARLLADDLNFDLTFVTRNFIGSYVLRCAFWLVSRKDHCLERVLRKSFWIKKSINKIPSVCRINFEKYFIKAIENFFPVFAWPDITTRGVGSILDSYANPRLRLGFA